MSDAWSSYTEIGAVNRRHNPQDELAWNQFQSSANQIRIFVLNSLKDYEKTIGHQVDKNLKVL